MEFNENNCIDYIVELSEEIVDHVNSFVKKNDDGLLFLTNEDIINMYFDGNFDYYFTFKYDSIIAYLSDYKELMNTSNTFYEGKLFNICYTLVNIISDFYDAMDVIPLGEGISYNSVIDKLDRYRHNEFIDKKRKLIFESKLDPQGFDKSKLDELHVEEYILKRIINSLYDAHFAVRALTKDEGEC